MVNKLRYRNDDYTERYLKGGQAIVAYNPDDASTVWLFEDGIFTEFELAESRFQHTAVEDAKAVKVQQKRLIRSAVETNTQARIDLLNAIDVIAASASKRTDTRVQDIRTTRKKERNKAHRDYMRGGECYDG